MGSRSSITSNNKEEDDQDDVPLPGFRFHPTDEELVGFYLRRKVEKRPIRIELINQADIYKYDPWDLPKSSNVGDKEWYFFCKRGRKYRNSIRPNRVTGSGFWKATGIDRPIYSSTGERRDCIGLKKSLVYYRGSAGKGTKTDWMMHEFRLPSTNKKSTKDMDSKSIALEAEVWTLCRILKREVSYRKCTLTNPEADACSSQTGSMDSSHQNNHQTNYISFNASILNRQNDEKSNNYRHLESDTSDQQFLNHFSSSVVTHQVPSSASSYPSPVFSDMNELLRHADWEDLRSIMDYAATANNPFYL